MTIGFKYSKSILLAAILVTLVIFAPGAKAAFKYLTEGMEAPDVKGQDIVSGETISSKELAKENLVIIVFWATWSERSLEQLKEMSDLYEEFAGNPIKIIAVNVDGQNLSGTALKAVETKITKLDLSIPVIIDKSLDIYYKYGVIAVPSTAVVDTSGTLRYGPAGYSLTTRDRIIDSIQIFLGIKKPDLATSFREGYQPKKRSSRFYNMALNLSQINMHERALAVLDSAKIADTLFSAPYSLTGEVLINLDRSEEAVTEFVRAVELDTMSVTAWAGWGRALLKSGDHDLALEKLTKALELDDAYTPALLDLGLCLSQTGQTEAAIDSLEEARDLNRTDPKVHFYLGEVYKKAGQYSEAAEAFSQALQLIYPPD